MKVLITNKRTRLYGYIVDAIKRPNNLVQFLDPTRTNKSAVFKETSVTEAFNPEPRVGDEFIGLRSASKEYYHTQKGFVGVVCEVDDNEITIRGFSTREPELELTVGVDKKHFELYRVHKDNIPVALGQVPAQDAGRADEIKWGELAEAMKERDNPWVPAPRPMAGRVAPIQIVVPEPVAKPVKAKPVKPMKAGLFGAADKVKLSPDSLFNDGSPANPVDVTGVVQVIVKGKLPVQVKWANGFLNSYAPKDLIKDLTKG